MLRNLIIGTLMLLPVCAVAQAVRDKLAPVLVKRCENMSKPYEQLRRAPKTDTVSNKKKLAQAKKDSIKRASTKKDSAALALSAKPQPRNVPPASGIDADSLPSIHRRDYIKLYVDSLRLLRRNVPAGDKIVVYIDDIAFDDLALEFLNDTTAMFMFERNALPNTDKAKAWAYFYKKPRSWRVEDRRISLGYSHDQAVQTTAFANVIIYQPGWRKFGLAIIVLLFSLLVYLGKTTDLLRDEGTLPPQQKPYSLARTQFAFWLVFIASAYLFLWCSTGELPALTNSTLILLGISGGTSIAAKLIDNTQALSVSPMRHSEQFLKDILSDENGVSVHRLQMVVFTFVTGFIFIHDVSVYYEMPEFDPNLLLLMGISSGTYAGFKTAEYNPTTPVG